jgi:hypothetical protein
VNRRNDPLRALLDWSFGVRPAKIMTILIRHERVRFLGGWTADDRVFRDEERVTFRA